MKELYLEFLESSLCENCGSQRCDQSPEWVSGCELWKNFLEEKLRNID